MIAATSYPRPRIAVVSDAVYPWNIGGKEVRYHHLTTRLARAGFDIDVYTMHWWDGPRTTTIDGVRFRAICRCWPLYAGRRRSIVQALAFSFACLALLWRRFDAIEADHMPYLHLFPLWLVARLRRRPLVVTWHEWWGREYWKKYLGTGGVVAAVIESISLRLPDHVIADSPATARRLFTAGRSPATITVIPNGIDSHAIDAVAPAESEIDVLFVGRLLEHKNADVLLGALARLHRSGHGPSCVIVGTGPEGAKLEQLAGALGIAESVTFTGRVSDAAGVYALMKAARVFVLPSVREGFGIVVVEALACGTRVITSDHLDNYARLLIEHGVDGWVCPPDADSLAAFIDLALADAGGSRTSAGKGAAERYDWDRLVDDVALTYVAVCGVRTA